VTDEAGVPAHRGLRYGRAFQEFRRHSVRATATIGVILLTLGGCAGTAAPTQPPTESAALRCEPWPDAAQPPSDARLAQSADQSLPGTDSLRSPVAVVVGNACVVLPADNAVVGLYCGAAREAAAPLPCLVGEECAVGSIMVTDVARFDQGGGVATCATFETWSKTAARSIFLWAKTR
jgi:hypothetical protein